MFKWEKEYSEYAQSVKNLGIRPYRDMPRLRKTLGDELHILVFQDIFYSMLALSPKTYASYIYTWGKFIGAETTKQSLKVKHKTLTIKLNSKLFYMNLLEDKSIIDIAFKWLTYYRIGIPELIFLDKTAKTFRISIDELMNSWDLPNIHKKTCYFPTGFFAGSFETILGRPVNIVETQCISNGNKHCELGGAVELPEHKFDVLTKKDYSKIQKSIYDRMFVEKRSRSKLSDWAHLVMLQIFYTGILLSSRGGHTMLYWVGKNSGKEIGKRIVRKRIKNKNKRFTELFNYLKIGKLSTTKSKESKNNIKYIVKESAFSVGTKFGQKVDSYIAGMICGFLEATMKKQCSVIETKCIADGNHQCEFITV
ncbi:MAG: hypothetical protein GOV02_02155 [Candidatus Aenigmarchaeota archaeon]|nr:hypothetical protein [Candidatus Aenigmarchaeota archaeon]